MGNALRSAADDTAPLVELCPYSVCSYCSDTRYIIAHAVWRAALLAQTDLQTLPVVAGERITDDAAELARAMRVWQVLDGRVTAPNGH